MNLNEQQNQRGVLIETPHVPLCVDLNLRYFSEQPNTMYEINAQYPFSTFDLPMSIFRYEFEEIVKSACTLIMQALEADKKRKKYEEQGQNDFAGKCSHARDMALASAVDVLSVEIINNAQSFPDIIKEYSKIRNKSGHFLEIPLLAFDGEVKRFSQALELSEEITSTLILGTLYTQKLTDGFYNKRHMYKILFKQMVALSFNQELLDIDELFEGIATISKFFGDYNIIKEHAEQEDVFQFIDKNFPEGKIEEFEKLQTAEERRNFLNKFPLEIIGIYLSSFEAPDKIVPIGGYFNPVEGALKSLDELREKGLDVLRISEEEEKETRQKQEQMMYKAMNAELKQLVEL